MCLAQKALLLARTTPSLCPPRRDGNRTGRIRRPRCPMCSITRVLCGLEPVASHL